MSIQSFSLEVYKNNFITHCERIYSKAASLNKRVYNFASTFFQSLPTFFLNLPKNLSLLQKPNSAAQRNKTIYSQVFNRTKNSLNSLLPHLSGISRVSHFMQSCKSSIFPSKNIPSFFTPPPVPVSPVFQESSLDNSSTEDDSTPLEIPSPSENHQIVPFTHVPPRSRSTHESPRSGSPTFTDQINQTWQQILMNRARTGPILCRSVSKDVWYNPLQQALSSIEKITKLGESSTPLYFPANLLQTATIGSFDTINGQFHLTFILPQADDSLYGSYKIEFKGIRQPIHAHLVRSQEEVRLSRPQGSSTLPRIRFNGETSTLAKKPSDREPTQHKSWQPTSWLVAGTALSVFCIGSGIFSFAAPTKEAPIIAPIHPPKIIRASFWTSSNPISCIQPTRPLTTPSTEETAEKPQNEGPNPFNWKNVVLVASIASFVLASLTLTQTGHR
jgi:hypothetical protein